MLLLDSSQIGFGVFVSRDPISRVVVAAVGRQQVDGAPGAGKDLRN